MGLNLSATELQTRIDAIEEALYKKGQMDISNYRINDRLITRIPVEELITLYKFYNSELERVNTAASVDADTGNPRKIRVRFL